MLLEEHDGQGRNKDHGRTEKKQQYEQIYKLPESEMPQRKDGQKEVVYGQEVADAVVRYFVVRSANDDAPDDKELGRANKAKGVETLRKNRGIPKKADIIRMNLLVEVLAQNGVLNNGPQLIDNAMAKIHDQPRRRPRVGGIQVAGYYAVRLRDPNETEEDRLLRRASLSLAEVDEDEKLAELKGWWLKAAAGEGSSDARAYQCRLTMLSEIALKLAREDLDSSQFEELFSIYEDPDRWAKEVEKEKEKEEEEEAAPEDDNGDARIETERSDSETETERSDSETENEIATAETETDKTRREHDGGQGRNMDDGTGQITGTKRKEVDVMQIILSTLSEEKDDPETTTGGAARPTKRQQTCQCCGEPGRKKNGCGATHSCAKGKCTPRPPKRPRP